MELIIWFGLKQVLDPCILRLQVGEITVISQGRALCRRAWGKEAALLLQLLHSPAHSRGTDRSWHKTVIFNHPIPHNYNTLCIQERVVIIAAMRFNEERWWTHLVEYLITISIINISFLQASKQNAFESCHFWGGSIIFFVSLQISPFKTPTCAAHITWGLAHVFTCRWYFLSFF